MSSNMALDPEPVLVATKVILHAGNARTLASAAMQTADQMDFRRASEKLDLADEEITAAHRTQTELIQAEARGEGVPLTLLLTHAQDTLMIAISEVQMTRRLLTLYKRLHAVESKLARR